MPELPEVEVVKSGLQKKLETSGEPLVIERFEFLRKDLRNVIPVNALRELEGSELLKISRRAKYLIFSTSKGDFLSHLGMTGSWRQQPRGEDNRTHDHVKIHFKNQITWTYCDPRRFGVFDRLDSKTQDLRLGHLGPEPLSDEFTADVFWAALRNRSSSLKAAVMDQKVVVGVGNIYASEALFLARIKPSVKAHKLSHERAKKLVQAIKIVLSKAIQAGGSTISDFESAESSAGYFQQQHQVYDRAGLACRVCSAKIKVAVTAGRSTFWCPGCQS